MGKINCKVAFFEFVFLPFKVQMWRKNLMNCVALTCVRLQVIRSGKDQLKNMFGFIRAEDEAWNYRFSDLCGDEVNNAMVEHSSPGFDSQCSLEFFDVGVFYS